MPKACSQDLRERVLEAVETGASRREAAERFEVSPSSAVKWIQRWQETGSIAAKPIGGSISPLEKHADWLLMLISEHPDLTLDEVRRDAQATDRRQPQCGLAIVRPSQHQL
jgi:transposase